MAEIFLGVHEKAGDIPNTNPIKGYHYFLVNVALEDVLTGDNTVSCCGYDIMGLERSGFDSEGGASYKDGRKVKAEDISKIFGFEVPNADVFEPYVGKPCRVSFNRKGQLSKIEFSSEVVEEIKKAQKGGAK